MNTFLTVLANDYRRTVSRLAGTIVMTVVMFVMIVLAVYVTGLQQIQGHIAFITGGSTTTVPAHPDYLEVTTVRVQPPRSDLYKQKYDAFISADADGTVHVDTLRNIRFRSMIESVFSQSGTAGRTPATGNTFAGRSTGVNIIGFLMMFLLMQAFSNLFVFADDKEQGQLVRIASAPASFSVYLAAHCVYSLSLIAPAWFMLVVLHICGVPIGFTLAGYALLILVIGLLGISIALLLNTFIKKPDNANMLGNAVLMLASLVSGSFYAAPPEHSFFNLVVRCLPQKAVMDFAQALAAGTALHHTGYLLYIVCCALVLLCISGTVLHRKYTAKI
jgi:ABC-2 type transport system permease protein